MSTLPAFTDFAYGWSTIAFASAWQGAIVAVIAIAVITRISKVSAATRSILWQTLLLSTVGVPLLVGWPIATEASNALRPVPQNVLVFRDRVVDGPSVVPSVNLDSGVATKQEQKTIPQVVIVPPDLVRWLVLCWMTVSAFLLVRLALGVARVLAIRRRSSPASEKIGALCARSGIEVTRIRLTDDLAVPGVVGYFRPVILVPRRVVHMLDERTLRHVLLHELAHVRRRDAWTTLALHVYRALMFPLPATHLLARRLKVDRELACDEWALGRSGANATDYVDSLLRIGEASVGLQMARPALVPLATTQLHYRIRSLLQGRIYQAPKAAWIRDTLLGIALAGVLIPLSAIAPAFAFAANTVRPSNVRKVDNLAPPIIGSAASNIQTPGVRRGSFNSGTRRQSAADGARTISGTASDGKSGTLSELVAQLGANDASARARAAYELAQYRRAAGIAIPQLIALLSDDARVSRLDGVVSTAWTIRQDREYTSPAEEAEKALLYVGRDALAPVTNALSTLGGRARERAAFIVKLLQNFD
jgi:beta-lactamase regulating signal transducer with metallopeptidase domain